MFFPITCVVVTVIVVVDVARLMFMLLEIQPRTTATTMATDFFLVLSIHFGLLSLSLFLSEIDCIRTVIDGEIYICV